MEVSPRLRRDRQGALLLTLCACSYLYVFPYQGQVGNPNEATRLFLTASLVEARTWTLEPARARWGDEADNDAVLRDGRVYSPKAPGATYLGLPGYALYYAARRARGLEPELMEAIWVVRVTASSLTTLFWLAAFWRWLAARGAHPALRGAVFLSVALGSPVYGYALLFTSHAQAAGAAFGAFALLRRARVRGAGTPSLAFAAGLLAAGVTLFEYPGVVASAALCAYAIVALRPRARLILFSLGALAPTLAMMAFQHGSFGNAFTPGHRASINPQYRDALHQGFYGATGFSPSAAWSLLFDPGFGLVALTPVLALAPFGAVRAWRRGERAEVITLAAISLGTTAAIASMNNWRGGWTVGARYLCTLVPLLAALSLDALDALASRRPRTAMALALGTTAAAMVLAGSVSAYYPFVPPEVTRPVVELVALCVREGYAPYTLGALFGLYGTASMLPLAALATGALARTTFAVEAASRARVLVGAALVAAVCVAPGLWPVPSSSEARSLVAFVTSRWEPASRHRRARPDDHRAAEPRGWPYR